MMELVKLRMVVISRSNDWYMNSSRELKEVRVIMFAIYIVKLASEKVHRDVGKRN